MLCSTSWMESLQRAARGTVTSAATGTSSVAELQGNNPAGGSCKDKAERGRSLSCEGCCHPNGHGTQNINPEKLMSAGGGFTASGNESVCCLSLGLTGAVSRQRELVWLKLELRPVLRRLAFRFFLLLEWKCPSHTSQHPCLIYLVVVTTGTDFGWRWWVSWSALILLRWNLKADIRERLLVALCQVRCLLHAGVYNRGSGVKWYGIKFLSLSNSSVDVFDPKYDSIKG